MRASVRSRSPAEESQLDGAVMWAGSTWRATRAIGDSHGSVSRTTVAPCLRCGFAERDHILLVAADIEGDDHVFSADLDHSVAPQGRLALDEIRLAAHDAEMALSIARERTGEAAAREMDVPALFAEQLTTASNSAGAMLSTVARRLPITASAKEARAGAPWLASEGPSLGRGATATAPPVPPEGAAGNPESRRNQAGSRSAARREPNAGASGELRNGVEAGERIVAQQQVGGPLFTWREGLHVVADALRKARDRAGLCPHACRSYRFFPQPLLDGFEKLYQKLQKKKNYKKRIDVQFDIDLPGPDQMKHAHARTQTG